MSEFHEEKNTALKFAVKLCYKILQDKLAINLFRQCDSCLKIGEWMGRRAGRWIDG